MVLCGEKQHSSPHLGENIDLLPDKKDDQQKACTGKSLGDQKIDEP